MAQRRRVDSPPDIERLLQKRGLVDLPEPRAKLVSRLRRAGGVGETALAAVGALPRHAFAPPSLWRMSYSDIELWSPTAFLPRPSVTALMVDAVAEGARPKRVLEYATGGGYMTALLSCVAERVYTVEHDPWQLWLSSDAFRELRIDRICQKVSDGRLGWPEEGPFDAIILSAAIPALLPEFLDQLAEGGVIVAPVGPFLGPHRLAVATRTAAGLCRRDAGPCFFHPLTGVWGDPPSLTATSAGEMPGSDFWSGSWPGCETLEGRGR